MRNFGAFCVVAAAPLLFAALSAAASLPAQTKRQGGEPWCAFHGVCGEYNPVIGNPVVIPCKVDMAPVPLRNETYEAVIKELTSDIWESAPVNEDGEKLFCCAPEQVADIQQSLKIPSLLMEKCPSCYRNFREWVLQLPCSPWQADFIRVNSYDEETNALIAVDFGLSEEFAYGTWDSCRGVKIPATGGSILQLLCGPAGSDCTHHELFDYLGDRNNGNAPFGLNFFYLDAPTANLTYFDYTAVACDQIAPGAESACECDDCPNACPAISKTGVKHG